MLHLGRGLVFLVLVSGILFAKGAEATVSSNHIVQGTTVHLYLKAEGSRAAFPSINAIAGSPVLSQGQSSQQSISIVNGQTTKKTSTTLTLSFVPEQSLVIPAYQVRVGSKVYKTKPITITVDAQPPATPNQAQASVRQPQLKIWMKSSKESVLLNESFVVSFYFSQPNSVRLSRNPHFEAPKFNDFYFKELEQVSPKQKNGVTLQEIRYLLTPKKVGNFTIDAAKLRVGLEDRSQQNFGIFFKTKWRNLRSNSLKVEVKPQVVDAQIYGNFKIDAQVDTTQTKTNKPVNLTLTLKGEGVLEDFIAPEYEIDGVTVYSDEPSIQTKVLNGAIETTYTKKYVFIASSDFTIPSKEISQYNAQTKEKSMLSIASYPITVKGAKKVQHLTESVNKKTSVATKTSGSSTDVPWQQSMVYFVLGVLSTLFVVALFLWFKQKKQSVTSNPNDALSILYPHMSNNSDIEEMVRKLYAKKRGKKVEIDKKALKEMVKKYR